MTVIPTLASNIDEENSAVKLARYAQICGIAENAFFGVNKTTETKDSCHPIWTLADRRMVARYLAEAQTEIEQITRYPLTPRWIVDEFQYYGFPVHATWCKLIEAGYKDTNVFASSVAVSYATDPAVITSATTVTDEDEIAVFHPGTEDLIYPSSVSIAAGVVTILIPRARLVKTASQDNTTQGLVYTDVPPSATSPFESTVDLARVFNNDDIEGGLIWAHRSAASCTCTCTSCCSTCGEYTETACMYIRNPETGAVDLLPAGVSQNVWTADCSTCYCTEPSSVRLNYRAGEQTMTAQIEDAIIRLAHSKMPVAPCSCGVANDYWSRDRKVPDNLSIEQATCRFGNSDGAYWAWKQAQSLKTVRGLAL